MRSYSYLNQSGFANGCAFFARPLRADQPGLAAVRRRHRFGRYPITMKKLLIILVGAVALIAIGLFVASFFVGSIVTKSVNRYGPGITGSPVTLADASISPFSGTGTLNNLFVGNPPGWKSEKAFSFGKVHLHVEPRSLLTEHIIINDMVIEAPEFVYETKIVSSNIKDILNNIEKSLGREGDKPADQPTTDDGKPLRFTVKSFRLENAKVTVGAGASSLAAQMPPLVLADLGVKEGGLTANELATAVVSHILANITRAVAGSFLDAGAASGAAGVDAATEAAKKAGGDLKRILGGEQKR